MKKMKLIIPILSLILIGCGPSASDKEQIAKESMRVEKIGSIELIMSKYPDNEKLEYHKYTLEGCEYVKVGDDKWAWGFHKGNCINPIHRNGHQTTRDYIDMIKEAKFEANLESLE